MLGTLVGRCRCAMSWCDLDLTFYLAVVTLTYIALSGYMSATVICRKLILGRTLVGGCRCATSWCDLDLTFDLAVVTLTVKNFVRAISLKL